MVKAAPTSALEMRQAEFALELLVITFDPPAQFGHVDEREQRGVFRQGREPIFRGLFFVSGPFDEYVHEVVISCGAEIIARHPCSYEREDFVFDPLHYLALIERKINALDQAAPLVGWRLPEEFATLRRLLEARMGKQGKREFVQVLRLMEAFKIEDVTAAVADAIEHRGHRFRRHQASRAV